MPQGGDFNTMGMNSSLIDSSNIEDSMKFHVIWRTFLEMELNFY